MSFPPAAALGALQQIAEDSLVHLVQLQDLVEVRNGIQVTKTWVNVGPVRHGLLVPASAGGTNIRADQPVVAGEWKLKLEQGVTILASQRAIVSGVTAEGETWARTVAVRRPLFPRAAELLREALVVDV